MSARGETPFESAVAYCVGLGKNPHEIVSDYEGIGPGKAPRVFKPRWLWFVGANPSVLAGATELSPRQIARNGGVKR